jgi:hypothetical protein
MSAATIIGTKMLAVSVGVRRRISSTGVLTAVNAALRITQSVMRLILVGHRRSRTSSASAVPAYFPRVDWIKMQLIFLKLLRFSVAIGLAGQSHGPEATVVARVPIPKCKLGLGVPGKRRQIHPIGVFD